MGGVSQEVADATRENFKIGNESIQEWLTKNEDEKEGGDTKS